MGHLFHVARSYVTPKTAFELTSGPHDEEKSLDSEEKMGQLRKFLTVHSIDVGPDSNDPKKHTGADYISEWGSKFSIVCFELFIPSQSFNPLFGY